LNIDTRIHVSSDFGVSGVKTDKILNLCEALEADLYVSGKNAMGYLDVDLLKKHNIEVEWFNYKSDYCYDNSNYSVIHELFTRDIQEIKSILVR
jgi:hypothetical protein